MRRTPPLALVAIALLLGVLPNASAQVRSPAEPPYPSESDLIEVMFAPESAVRLRAGRPVDLATKALAGVDRVLDGVDAVEWSRICDVPEETLDDIQARGKANTGADVYNLNNIYRLRFNDKDGTVDVWKLAAELEELPGVMLARPVPLPMEPPLPPNYSPQQNYLDPAFPAPTGIDARYAWTQPGGTGDGVTVCDLEYSWNYNHQDITRAPGSQINTDVADPFNNNNHGTAVIGEIVSDLNFLNWGTVGACYGAGLKTCGTYYGSPTPSWNVPGAIAVAIANLSAGDVILLEQQWNYGGYVPIEWWLDYSPNAQSYNGVYAAIVNAISVGIHVVEAGGNGNINTDSMVWYGDSGAIIVGAGGAYPGGAWPETNLERLSFSSYGSRFNLQGWGENVVTTGYGDLYSIEGPDLYYTSAFDGTSSASPIVAAAVACCQGYYLANISPVPLPPVAMRTLLVNTGTPQYFGNPGNIGPRPDCQAAMHSMQAPFYEFGDAPEGALAYSATGVTGWFPTCTTTGPAGSFVLHANIGLCYFGPTVDNENDGNAGNCPFVQPYDADECWSDGDAGLLFPPAYTIDAANNTVPCQTAQGSLGTACTQAVWGTNLDVSVTNNMDAVTYVNVLMDWDQNGQWGGSSMCPTAAAPEHVLVNLPVPPYFTGTLSSLGPPAFLIGPNDGYVWSRFTISDTQAPADWDGAGTFYQGETCDYLLQVEEDERADYGDAPEVAIAYPALGVWGAFPTCVNSGAAAFVSHQSTGQLYFGPSVDLETEGNAGNCPNFPPYDADECWNDGDAGLVAPGAYTIDAAMNVVPCTGASGSLGIVCTAMTWGPALDVQVTNTASYDAYVNVLIDWNQDGSWWGASQCPAGAAPEHVLVNRVVPAGFVGVLSALTPPPVLIGPSSGYVWSRFTVSKEPVTVPWDGSGVFQDGETSDHLLLVDPELEHGDYGDAPEGVIAYPATGVAGTFPTCVNVGPAGFVSHASSAQLFLGPSADLETDGNAGNCVFPPYDQDECANDGDAGLLFPGPYTIDGALNVVPCPQSAASALGTTCTMAVWGVNLDLLVTNFTADDAYVNVLMDWNQNGVWVGTPWCLGVGPAREHVLVDMVVPPGYSGPLSALGPPAFRIGPKWGYVWGRFTISEAPVDVGWDGTGAFSLGETSDYLLEVQRDMTGVEETEGPITATRLLPALPNPFYGATTIRFELIRPGDVSVGVYDVAGRMIRALIGGSRTAGRDEVIWDGRNDVGEKVASGMYFVRLRSEGRSYSSPLILLR